MTPGCKANKTEMEEIVVRRDIVAVCGGVNGDGNEQM